MAFVTVRHIEVVDETPMIAGTRFKVENIVAMVVWGDATIDWVVENFDLTRSQVHAALAYYYDNQALIDHALRENEELAREVGTPLADVIARLRAGQEDTA